MNHATKLAKSSKTDEHMTPEWILAFAREAMGCTYFNTDPATTTDNPTRATKFYTKETNGLQYTWEGNVWLNPPFSMNKEFVEATIIQKTHYKQLIYLAKADFRTSWSKDLMEFCDHFVVINDYVYFGGSKHAAIFSVVLYCFNTETKNLLKACAEYPQFKLMMPIY